MSSRNRWWSLALVCCGGLMGCGKSEEAAAPVAQNETAPAAEAHLTGRYPGLETAEASYPASLRPIVVLKTSAGDIRIRLEPEKAPTTVENFLAYVESGHYEGTIFHEVSDGYMILGGGFTRDMQPKRAGAPIRNEAHNGLLNKRGSVAMARQSDVIDSSTCQFFINLSDNEHLDHKNRTDAEYGYCVFGEVIEGMEVAEQIGKTPVSDPKEGKPEEAVAIRTAIRVRR